MYMRIMELCVLISLFAKSQSHNYKSHGSIIDKDGMAVAITSSVNLVFGSKVLDSETGIILNDEVSFIHGF